MKLFALLLLAKISKSSIEKQSLAKQSQGQFPHAIRTAQWTSSFIVLPKRDEALRVAAACNYICEQCQSNQKYSISTGSVAMLLVFGPQLPKRWCHYLPTRQTSILYKGGYQCHFSRRLWKRRRNLLWP